MGGGPRGPGKKVKVGSWKKTWSKSGRQAPGPKEKKLKLKLEKQFSKSGRRASGPREKKSKLKFGKRLGVRVGGGPWGPGRKS